MARKKTKAFELILTLLVLIGAINWGLVGLFGFNLVTAILGSGMATTVVYVLVGISGLVSGYKQFVK